MTILVRYSNGGRNAPTGEALSGHERQGEPPDGCLPIIDDEEFLGRQYEEVFDMFPVLEEKPQRAGDPQWWSTDDGRVRTGVDA